MNPSITAEQSQAIESALRIYWAGGEPVTTPSMEWLRSYLGLNSITSANFGRLVAQIHQHTLGPGQHLWDETRRWVVELTASELNDLSERASQQAISDPVWLRESLTRAGVSGDGLAAPDRSLSLVASALHQAAVRERVFGGEGTVAPNATAVIAVVETLQGMMAAAQKVWEVGASLTAQDCLSLGVVADEQGLTATQLDRLNAVLEGQRDESNTEPHTLSTLSALVVSVIALDKKLTAAPDAVDLTLDDFERLGIQGVTAANLEVVNQQLSDETLHNPGDGGLLQGGALGQSDLVQSVIDQQLIETMTVVITAIQNQQTAALTLQDYVRLGLVLPAEFDVAKFNTLLLSHDALGNAYPAYSLGHIERLQQLAVVSHKMALLSDALADNDMALNADDFEALSSVAQLGMASYHEQAQHLFTDVLKSSAQRGQVITSGAALSQIAHTISDLHRLASGGRAKATLNNERLEQIGLVAEGSQPLSDTTIKGLMTVVARTESSGAGIDSLGKLNAVVNSYQSVLNLANGSANSSARPTQAQFAALRINGVDSDLKAQLLGDLLDRKAANEVDSLSKLQSLAQVVSRVVAYAAGGPVAVTQADLERLGLQDLNEHKTASVLDQLRAHGADSSKIGQISQIQAMVYWPELSDVSLSSDTGTPGDWITKDTTQTITATLSQTLRPGMTVLGSVDGGLTWADITDKVSGTSIQWTQANLLAGTHGIRFKWQDAQANESLSASTAYTLDTVGPTQTLSNVMLSNDNGISNTDRITSQPVQTITATLSAGLAVNESLYGTVDGGLNWSDITQYVNGMGVNWAGVQLLEGHQNIGFKVQDLAGNELVSPHTAYTLNTNVPTSTVNAIANGAIAVFAPSDASAYTVNYTNEANVAQTVTVTKSGTTWAATGVPNGSAVLASTGTLRLNNDHVLDGSTVTVTTRDADGNVGLSTTVAASDTASQAGNPSINLGSYGKLMAPVQVEGKWFYVWDMNGDASLTSADQKTMNWLENTFFGGSTGTVITEANRSFSINGVQVNLPTVGRTFAGTSSTAGTAYSLTMDDPVATSNATFDDLAAIWDAFNGTSSSTNISGTPPRWEVGYYASASHTAMVDTHVAFNFISGFTHFNSSDVDGVSRYFALQVL